LTATVSAETNAATAISRTKPAPTPTPVPAPMATELECVRSLLLTTADVGLAIAVTDVVVALEDVGACDSVEVELGSENVCGLPMIVMV
jgi:hypothetical protein